ncbi:unnamed protein product [Paramecium octaurelia]|uniref:Uncharacterized protein n=1 Tax=Paramecium octaurelia TaxID=43137 RepID=A0A8S1YBN2_PAROT|nr:unnamed protein product [Paramecium octaurelia]
MKTKIETFIRIDRSRHQSKKDILQSPKNRPSPQQDALRRTNQRKNIKDTILKIIQQEKSMIKKKRMLNGYLRQNNYLRK